jgi:hypothetical protein
MSAQPSSGQAIVSVAAVAAGLAAAYYVQPAKVIDYTIAKVSNCSTSDTSERLSLSSCCCLVTCLTRVLSLCVTRDQTSSVVINFAYAEDPAESKKRGFIERSALGVSKFIDASALALSWKANLAEFDQHSLIKSTTLVTCAVGIVTMAITKGLINAAAR